MTTGIKWTIGIVAVLVIGVVLWKTGIIGKSNQPTSTAAVANSTTPKASTTTPVVNVLPTAATDTSNAALVQDEVAIDTQMQGLNSDSASVNQSLNDKPVAQSY